MDDEKLVITDVFPWMKDITEEYPIHFSETLSVTGQAYKYDRRFYGEYDGCAVSVLFGEEREGWYNCKGVVRYGGRSKSFSFEQKRACELYSLFIRAILVSIRETKKLEYLPEPEYAWVGKGIVERLKDYELRKQVQRGDGSRAECDTTRVESTTSTNGASNSLQ